MGRNKRYSVLRRFTSLVVSLIWPLTQRNNVCLSHVASSRAGYSVLYSRLAIGARLSLRNRAPLRNASTVVNMTSLRLCAFFAATIPPNLSIRSPRNKIPPVITSHQHPYKYRPDCCRGEVDAMNKNATSNLVPRAIDWSWPPHQANSLTDMGYDRSLNMRVRGNSIL